MTVSTRKLQMFVLATIALTLTTHAQGGSITITPANPTLLVGQSVTLTPTGAVAPTAITAGSGHTCVLYSDQSLRCTGQNSQGQVGNGGWTAVLEPAVAPAVNPVGIRAGMEHSCSLVADGRMQCWGENYTGVLGGGTFGGFATTPQFVQNMATAIKDVAGGFHNCAILQNNTAQCWGRNQDGQLGNGDATTDMAVPVTVPNLGSFTDLAAGGYHTCALYGDGTAKCWGRNGRGQVGDGTVDSPIVTPHAVSGLTTAVALSLGGYHSCALLQDKTVQCWGQSDSGQIGAPGLAFSSSPVTVNGIANATSVSTGFLHSCALLADGTARCWGNNQYGQLGDGTTANSAAPVQVQGIANARALALGWGHTCALMSDSTVRCWGEGDMGEFGAGTNTNSLTPVTMHQTGMTWTSSNPNAATVSASGVVNAVGRGTATISVSDSVGHTGATTVTVQQLFTLATMKQGDGTGTVTSSPAGIACGSTCTSQFVSDSQVTLTAAPAANSLFTGWTGCDSVSGATCTVSMTAGRSVTAIFMLKRFTLTVSTTGVGKGTVTSSPAGINCGSACRSDFVIGTTVTLTATPGTLSVLTGWTGCDTSNGNSCTVTMAANKSVSAEFTGVPLF
ncbi:MAG TPA: Ig-like domain-containing protein [Vicinamibacterales bacterium]|nr:Ig-like domain-containing protein [Vicinamibacterales bacterium]